MNEPPRRYPCNRRPSPARLGQSTRQTRRAPTRRLVLDRSRVRQRPGAWEHSRARRPAPDVSPARGAQTRRFRPVLCALSMKLVPTPTRRFQPVLRALSMKLVPTRELEQARARHRLPRARRRRTQRPREQLTDAIRANDAWPGVAVPQDVAPEHVGLRSPVDGESRRRARRRNSLGG